MLFYENANRFKAVLAEVNKRWADGERPGDRTVSYSGVVSAHPRCIRVGNCYVFGALFSLLKVYIVDFPVFFENSHVPV